MALTNATDGEIPRSTQRLLDLLEIVLADGSCNLTTAATRAELTPTTALRHLRALEARGYLERDDHGDFSAGPTMVRLSASLRNVGAIEQLISSAQPLLDALAEQTGESTYLAVSDGRKATYVATAESQRSIRHVGGVGQIVDLGESAVGEALRAPGVVAQRTGAVEPDITALSLAVGEYSKVQVAVSVVGPEHRLGATQATMASAALADAVDGLQRALGLDQEAVAS